MTERDMTNRVRVRIRFLIAVFSSGTVPLDVGQILMAGFCA
jgi:hypothetical protein